MKYRKRNKRCHEKRSNKDTVNKLELTNRNSNQIIKKRQRNYVSNRRQSGPMQYVFYAILNTDLHMNRGTAAANIAVGLMLLYNTIDTDQVKCQYIDSWTKNGQRIVILKGYDHRHLKYLQQEVKFIALGTYAVRQKWGRNKAIIVLTVFGQKEDLEDVFEGLTYLR
ncbi:uncharacterized protein LOC122570819 [Bombus pyrosoma]|uniref:uncharacterized protein LOC122570819 n=1 Tax=Bombus pyrosoma TaxID=396416 RepID=UPI001CB8D502|nr:uncharacterized protein LOC122570819 [Bombus pyrosoma]